MIPGVYHMTNNASYRHALVQGATLTRVITITGFALAAGDTARMDIREDDAARTLILTLSTTNSRLAINVAANTITMTLTAAVTAALDFEYAKHDLEIVRGTTVYRLLEGDVELDKEATTST